MSPRIVWPIVLLLLASSASRTQAQGVASSFEQLGLLVRAGDTVTVRDAAGGETTGKIASLSSSSLKLLTSAGQPEFGEASVTTIFQRRSDSLANGAKWGLIGGLGFASVVAILSCYSEDCDGSTIAPFIAIYAAVGTGVGVGVDALITHPQMIFERRAGPVTFGATPLVSHGQQGFGLSLRF